jgi:hypothetical protein
VGPAAIDVAAREAGAAAAGTWAERDGVVAMEAERGKGDWTPRDDPAASAGRFVNDPGRGAMSYAFTVTKTGRFFVFLRARKGTATPATDDENDVFVEIDGQRLYGGDGKTRPEGMRTNPTTWAWTFLPKGPGGHTPDAIRDLNVYALIEKPGPHELVLRHRSVNFSVDKIVLKHESVADAMKNPSGTGPAETTP